jgi:dCMP deaminase
MGNPQTRLSKWDLRFLGLAKHIGSWSKDPSTKVGCVIADSRNRLVGTGFNGFPHGVKDLPERLEDRDLKYKLVQHAERNAVAFSTNDISGCTAYVWPQPPCAQCAGALIQAGIKRIVAPDIPRDHERWGRDHELAFEMYAEAGVVVDFERLEDIENML